MNCLKLQTIINFILRQGYHHDEVDEFRQQPQQRPVHLETRFPTKSLTYETRYDQLSSFLAL